MDRDIADRMRSENVEQFHTLVRMHLSFELDSNTDSVEYVSSRIDIKHCATLCVHYAFHMFILFLFYFSHLFSCIRKYVGTTVY